MKILTQSLAAAQMPKLDGHQLAALSLAVQQARLAIADRRTEMAFKLPEFVSGPTAKKLIVSRSFDPPHSRERGFSSVLFSYRAGGKLSFVSTISGHRNVIRSVISDGNDFSRDCNRRVAFARASP